MNKFHLIIHKYIMIGRLFTKYEFNKLCKHWNLIKLTNQFENHNGYQFKT